ncbi:MAG: hypothetical protein HQL91_02960 [Magnetococcales bacterium]|nr:hypothetical protein [Magnetococcales bacterium]
MSEGRRGENCGQAGSTPAFLGDPVDLEWHARTLLRIRIKQNIVKRYSVVPETVSLAEELIRERRSEQERELRS